MSYKMEMKSNVSSTKFSLDCNPDLPHLIPPEQLRAIHAFQPSPTMPAEIKDKQSQPIKEGDHVFARSRGGRHEGDVEKIVTAAQEAEQEGVKHPPKV